MQTAAVALVLNGIVLMAPATAHEAATKPTELWAKRYNGPADGSDRGAALVLSPDGSRLFVTGQSDAADGTKDYVTIAYATATGARLWLSRLDNPFSGDPGAAALAVSPDGSRVFVTGVAATVAYAADSGARLWVNPIGLSLHGLATASDVAVSPHGTSVFVVGSRPGSSGSSDYATIAYDSATGAKQWGARYNGPGNGADDATALAVSPDGTRVVVTGSSLGGPKFSDYATVAYAASTGNRKWVSRYDGPANKYDWPSAVGISPDGSQVFVTGSSVGPRHSFDYGTVAYDTATGAEQWAKDLNREQNGDDSAEDLAVSPDGSLVFVTGTMYGFYSGSDSDDYGTVAYETDTGARRWARGFNGRYNEGDYANAIAVSPDGSAVVVTGEALIGETLDDYDTRAYDPLTGDLLWSARYDGPGHRTDAATDVVVGPHGSHVFVTGRSFSDSDAYTTDYATVAYSTDS